MNGMSMALLGTVLLLMIGWVHRRSHLVRECRSGFSGQHSFHKLHKSHHWEKRIGYGRLFGYVRGHSGIEKGLRGTWYLHGFIDAVKEELELTPAQHVLFEEVLQALQAQSDALRFAVDKAELMENHATVVAGMEFLESMMLTLTEVLQQLQPPIRRFYHSLEPQQQFLFDDCFKCWFH
ncbi:MAG: Spy/CpxP family protein refolding chaperone [Gammaproteobacteria bacterium]|nr:Spy/CpxP family protein refolding chaperone [Gammaproteobacteria bacterium]MDH5799465.1 Spy/CpxP family protein refolding chaperone [Gammaproteobacteria bacterium]